MKSYVLFRLGIGRKVPESNPGGAKFFGPIYTDLEIPPSFLYKGYRVSLPGVKRPGRGVANHLLLSPSNMGRDTALLRPQPVWHETRWPNFYLFTSKWIEEKRQNNFNRNASGKGNAMQEGRIKIEIRLKKRA